MTLFCDFYIIWCLLVDYSNRFGFFIVLCDLWLRSSATGCVLQTERSWSDGGGKVWSIHAALFSERVLASELHTVPLGGRRVVGCEYCQVSFHTAVQWECSSFHHCISSAQYHVRKERHIGKWSAWMHKTLKWVRVSVTSQPDLSRSKSAEALPASISW